MNNKLILYIAKKVGLFSNLETSTKEIAKAVNLSQQSVSRILIDLEKEEYIKRDVSFKGISISLTNKSINYLKEEYEILKKILKSKKKLFGKIFQGIGEGKYYIKKYQKQIEKKIGYSPYLGTLNLKVKKENVKSFLNDLKPLTISEFKTKSRTYGKIELYKIIIGGVEGAIIKPERTMHDETVVEIIGPSCFRTGLNLKEGDIVEIEKIEGI